MKIGIIGTGEVGSTLTRRLTRLGHTVSIANSRGPGSAAPAITSFTPPITGFGQTVTSGPSRPTLADLAKETGAHAVTVTDAVKNVDLVVVALNTKNLPDLPKGLFRDVTSDVVVVNTSNYLPLVSRRTHRGHRRSGHRVGLGFQRARATRGEGVQQHHCALLSRGGPAERKPKPGEVPESG